MIKIDLTNDGFAMSGKYIDLEPEVIDTPSSCIPDEILLSVATEKTATIDKPIMSVDCECCEQTGLPINIKLDFDNNEEIIRKYDYNYEFKKPEPKVSIFAKIWNKIKSFFGV